MALTVSPKNYLSISTCESTTGWTGNKVAVVPDYFKQSQNSLGFTFTTAGNNDAYITGSWNLDGIKHLRIWFMTVALKELQTDALGGIQFLISDGTSTGYYYVGGKTTYPGGWYNLVVDLSRAVDAGTKPVMNSITSVGIRVVLTSAPKNVQNTWLDNLICCDGLICISDTQFALQDIYDKDNDPAVGGWGIVRKFGGAYYLVGNLEFGDNVEMNSCDFKDMSQSITFEDRKVHPDLYEIKVVGNTTGATKFQLGDKPGTAGISGCLVRTQALAQTPKFKITCTDINVSDFKLYGTSFLDAGAISLPENGANREVLNCNFEACGEIAVSTCVVKNCNFISSDAAAVLMSDVSHCQNITKCNFITCTQGMRITAYGVGYDFNALMFSDTGWPHVNNDCGQALSIGKSNQSNPSTWTGTEVTFTGSINLTMTVKGKVDGVENQPIVDAWAFIDQTPPESPWIMNMQTNTSGIAIVNWTGGSVSNSTWRIRKYGYKNFKQAIDIGEVNISLPITLIVDPQQI